MTKTMMKTTILSLVAALGLVATGARADDSKPASDSAVTSDTMNANKKDDLDRMGKKKNKDAAKPSSTDPSAAPATGVTGSSATSPATPPPADSTSPSSTPPPAPPK
jgi:hypothetical protein